MKTLLFAATVIGFSASAALADCSYHKVNAEADVDRSVTTASVEKEQAGEQTLTKAQQMPEDDKTVE